MKYIFFITLFVFLSCSYNKDKNVKVENPCIKYLYSPDYADYYLYGNFEDKEDYIKYLFAFVKSKKGYTIEVITDRKTFRFEDSALMYIDTTKQRFTFDLLSNESQKNRFEFIRVNFLKSENISFKEKKGQEQNALYADFDSLNLNIVQNMLDFARTDSIFTSIRNIRNNISHKDTKVTKNFVSFMSL